MEVNTEPYTPEEEEKLRQMWRSGAGIKDICAALRRSWGSVVRKKRLMKLTPREVRRPAPLPPAQAEARRDAAVVAATAASRLDIGESGGRLYTDGSPLRQRCCWPMWGAQGRPTHVYCDDAIVAGQVYCPLHHNRSKADHRQTERATSQGMRRIMQQLP